MSVLGVDSFSYGTRRWHHGNPRQYQKRAWSFPGLWHLFFLPLFPFIAVSQNCILCWKLLVRERLQSEEAQAHEDLVQAITTFYRDCSRGHRSSGNAIDSLLFSVLCASVLSVTPPFLTPPPAHVTVWNYITAGAPRPPNQNAACFKLGNSGTSAWHPWGKFHTIKLCLVTKLTFYVKLSSHYEYKIYDTLCV